MISKASVERTDLSAALGSSLKKVGLCWIIVTVFQSVLYLAGLDKMTTTKKDMYEYIKTLVYVY